MNSTPLTAAFTVTVFTLCAPLAQASDCFTFDKMDEDTTYDVGDVFENDLATIRIAPYSINGATAQAASRGAKRSQSQIAGGSAPELDAKLVALIIEPTEPASRISMRIAQNINPGSNTGNTGLAVNREGRKSNGGFAAFNGTQFRTGAGGTVRVAANLASPSTGNWHVGTLDLLAQGTQIDTMRLGGHTYRIDEFCLEN